MRRTTVVLAGIWAMLAASPASAQGNSLAARVRALNTDLLQLQAQLARATPAEQAALRAQAAPIFEQRLAALSALIEQDASEALSAAFPPELAAQMAALFPQSASRLEVHGTWQGMVEYLIEDDVTMTAHRSLRRLRFGQEALGIYFAGPEPAGLKSGDLLAVSGMRAGGRVAAASGNIQGSVAEASSCTTVGAQNTLVILVNFPSYTLTPGVDEQLLRGIFLGNAFTTKPNTPDWSVDDFWKQNSDGKTWVNNSGGAGSFTVVGPFLLNSNFNANNACDSDGVRAAALAAADPYVNFQNYTRILIVMPPNGACSWAGLGYLGCPSWNSQDGAFVASVAWQRSDQMSNRSTGVRLTTHEFGHNLTLGHASSRDFGAEALGPLGAQGTLNEYGDLFSTMGSWNFGFYSSQHAVEQLSWLAQTANYQVVESSGTYSVQAYEARPAGMKALKIRRGTGNDAWLWLEARTNQGIYDSQLSSQVWTGALIHYKDSYTGSKTHLLDFTTGTSSFSDPALAVGQTWTDPYSNVSISVLSAVNGFLNVAVNYGPVPCTLANPTVTLAPDPATTSEGTPASFTVSVRNNDTSSCSPRTFSLASTEPSAAGWGSTFSTSSLTLGPGATGTAALTKTPPSGAIGSFLVNASASEGGYSGSDTATLHVTGPLTATVATNASTYKPRSTVTMTATVSNGQPVSGASVKFTLTKPGGATTTKNLTTGSNGQAVWSYKLSPKDPNGSYTVTVLATYNSQTASGGPATFTVAP